MLGNTCPSHYSPMNFIFTHPRGVLSLSCSNKVTELSLPHDLMLFLHFSMPTICFVLLGEWEERSHDFGVWEGRFCHCEQVGRFPHVFSAFFLFSPSWETHFWVANELDKRPTIFGWLLSPFLPTWNPYMFMKIELLSKGCFPHFIGSFVVANSVSGNAQRMGE